MRFKSPAKQKVICAGRSEEPADLGHCRAAGIKILKAFEREAEDKEAIRFTGPAAFCLNLFHEHNSQAILRDAALAHVQ